MSGLGYSAAAGAQDVSNLLAVGEETVPRSGRIESSSLVSGRMWLTFFTARKSETTTQVRLVSGGTGTTTPTLVRLGLYAVDGVGNGTLVASTANDTALLASPQTTYLRSWSASYTKSAGTRHALGVLVVAPSGAGSVNSIAVPSSGMAAELTVAPRLMGNLSSLSDLPGSFTDASLGAPASPVYAAILP